MVADYFFFGQGKVYSSIRDGSGIPLGFTDFGNCSTLELLLGKNLSLYATGGSQTPAKGVRSAEPPTLTMNIENISSDNLAMLVYGAHNAVAAGTVSSEVVIGYVGKMSPLVNINLSSFTSLMATEPVIINGDTLWITYTLGSDYTVDLPSGSISIPLGSTITNGQSLHANYVKKASTKIALGTVAPPFQWLRFHGLNTAQNRDPIVVDAYKVRFYPIEKLPLIGNVHLSLQVQARIFYDSTQTDNTTDGRLVRIRKV